MENLIINIKDINDYLEMLGVELDPIPKGTKHLLGMVENSHRQDDEYFLEIHAERCENKVEFLRKAERWQDTWNFFRPSFGIGMNGKTLFLLYF